MVPARVKNLWLLFKDAVDSVTNIDCLLALSQLITLNTRLLQNLMATTPLFALSTDGYTAKGGVPEPAVPRRISVEV